MKSSRHSYHYDAGISYPSLSVSRQRHRADAWVLARHERRGRMVFLEQFDTRGQAIDAGKRQSEAEQLRLYELLISGSVQLLHIPGLQVDGDPTLQ